MESSLIGFLFNSQLISGTGIPRASHLIRNGNPLIIFTASPILMRDDDVTDTIFLVFRLLDELILGAIESTIKKIFMNVTKKIFH